MNVYRKGRQWSPLSHSRTPDILSGLTPRTFWLRWEKGVFEGRQGEKGGQAGIPILQGP